MPTSPPTHRPAGWKPAEKWKRTPSNKGKTTTQRGYGWKWQQLREQILKRDSYLCKYCLEDGRVTVGKEVDHKLPKSQGGTDSPDNLQTLCTIHHKAKTANEGRAG
jgi:5-methylcytosine-specific restriction protein A